MLKIVHDAARDAMEDPETMTVDLDELFRVAAQELLVVTLLAERRAYLDAHAEVVDDAGRRMVVGNGYARPRAVMTGAGMVEVKAPRVDDRRDDEKFSSVVLPAYMRRSPKVTEVLPLLYLRGLSTGDFGPAVRASAPRPACRPPRSAGSPRYGKPSSRSGTPGISPRSTTCTGGPTACTSTSASKRIGCAAWSSSVSAPTARKSWRR